MFFRLQNRFCAMCLVLILLTVGAAAALSGASWVGVLTDSVGKPVAGAVIKLHSADHEYRATTAASGKFEFAEIAAGTYEISVKTADRQLTPTIPFVVKDASALTISLQLTSSGQVVQGQTTQGQEL